jgi:hypothetical protein
VLYIPTHRLHSVVGIRDQQEKRHACPIPPRKAIRRVLQRPRVDDVGELEVVVVLAQNI